MEDSLFMELGAKGGVEQKPSGTDEVASDRK